MKTRLAVCAGLMAVLAPFPAAHAIWSISNGDFEADTVQTSNVTGWYNSLPYNPTNWIEAAWAGPVASPNGTPVLGLGYENGELNWAYQSIGTNDTGSNSVIVVYDLGSFTGELRPGPPPALRDMFLNISVFAVDETYSGPSNDVDITYSMGAILLNRVYVFNGTLAPGEMTYNNSVILDVTGTEGMELYLRFQNLDSPADPIQRPEMALDNIEVFASVPALHDPIVSPQNGAVTNPVSLVAAVEDWASTVDADTMELHLDGVDITSNSTISTVGLFTTISNGPAILEGGTTHTARLVVAGIDPVSSLITNDWVFTVADSFNFISREPAPESVVQTNAPVIEVVIADLDSEVDAVSLFLDDIDVTTNTTVDTVSGTTTVTHASAALDPGAHSVTVVVTGIDPPVTVTNSWIFYNQMIPPVTPPTLQVLHNGSMIRLSWPTNEAGFEVQTISNLVGSVWQTPGWVPVIEGTNYVVTNMPAADQGFYRLILP